jgi:hypothetical protein
MTRHYDFTAIPDAAVPQAVDPLFQVQTWLRLAGHEPVGDVKWDEAAPTYSREAAKRGG